MSRRRLVLCAFALILIAFPLTLAPRGEGLAAVRASGVATEAFAADEGRTAGPAGSLLARPTGRPLAGVQAYPPDPTADIHWSAGYGGVADIALAFSNARATENSQLGTSIPPLTLPSQGEWDAKSNGEKALWLINQERVDRGVAPLTGVEANVAGVAQYYADYLLDNNAWGHNADGRSPWQRLADNPAIGACHDDLAVAENLAVFVTSGDSIPLPVERALFLWMYTDGGCCGWGHRHTVLWYPYTDNGGPTGSEGFLGLGRATGGPYQGPFPQVWPLAEMIVLNVFDPCASWDYGKFFYAYLPLLPRHSP